jgi:hypothetical protein
MEITQSILVAIMFVMILSIGIASILMGSANLVNKRSKFKRYWIHTSWVVLLLLMYFNLFWQTTALFSIEDWMFGDFLYVIAGPIIIVFATDLLMPDPASEGSNDLQEHYFSISGQFFFLIALSQVWAAGTDLVLRRGLTTGALFNLAVMGLAGVLVFSREPKTHRAVSLLIWAVFLLSITSRGLGLI